MDRVQLSPVNLVSFKEEEVGANRRRPGRLRCERLTSSWGSVLDLSATGARLSVRSMGSPRKGGARSIVFQTIMGASLPIRSRVMWVKPRGFLRYEVGVHFEQLDEARRAQLAEMGRVHAGRTCVASPGRAA